MKTVCIKAEGSNKTGLGHISRSISLIDEIPQDWNTKLIVNDDPSVRAFLDQYNVDTIFWPHGYQDNQFSCQVLIFDQITEDPEFIQNIKSKNNCLVVGLDYFNYRDPHVDIAINLFDQSIQKTKLKDSVKYHEGLEFAIIGQRFRPYRKDPQLEPGDIQNILVIMGGADPENKTTEVVKFIEETSQFLNVDVVIGPLCPHEKSIRSEILQKTSNRITLHKSPLNLPELMEKAQMVISGCATTFFELSYLGKPAIILSQNEREHRFCKYLQELGVAIYGQNDLQGALALISLPAFRQQTVRRQMKLFDGQGANRILSIAGIIE
jgi:UDP-2,4-diacetamido-2,4,6-trideoxy-beta-L-altropyranose hydrolase